MQTVSEVVHDVTKFSCHCLCLSLNFHQDSGINGCGMPLELSQGERRVWREREEGMEGGRERGGY